MVVVVTEGSNVMKDVFVAFSSARTVLVRVSVTRELDLVMVRVSVMISV